MPAVFSSSEPPSATSPITPYRDGAEFMRDTTTAHLVVREACDQAGFKFAFPTRTVELHQSLS